MADEALVKWMRPFLAPVALPAGGLPLGLEFSGDDGFCMEEAIQGGGLQCAQECVDADERMALMADHGKPLSAPPLLQGCLKALDQSFNL